MKMQIIHMDSYQNENSGNPRGGRPRQPEDSVMFNRQNFLKSIAVAGATSLMAASALADSPERIHYVDELESCVTAIKSEIDMDGVNRIRHIVTKSTPQGIAYELRLRVSTYAGDAEREYSAYCLVTGNSEPSRLRVTRSKS
jgi:hypothetical protein